MPDIVLPKRALLSVSDKSGLVELGQALAQQGVELVSTGGTAKALRDAGLTVQDVADLTGFPEMMDGRVKTLHPAVHGGLLARRDLQTHLDAMAAHGIGPIDLVVVNLYPFEATVAADASYEEAIENIDIGGPAMIRSAAKNHDAVAVVVDPEDYGRLCEALVAGGTSLALRQELAQIAYARTAAYDSAVSTWLAGAIGLDTPRRVTVAGQLAQGLRYGENPHQAASFYSDGSTRPGVARARQHQGKELSYNNLNDTDAAFELVAELGHDAPACAIIKHANPCGVASGGHLAEAYRAAFQCDQTSAFGGIVALNQELDAKTARAITEIFTEVVIAPSATAEAVSIFGKMKNLRLLTTGGLPDPRVESAVIKPIAGGFLRQDRDSALVGLGDLRVVTERAPTDAELTDLHFAWIVAKHVKSNAIVYAKNRATVGIGAGQMSRVDSSRIAARKAQDMAEALGLDARPTEGSAVASDAFFPFADGLLAAVEAGATAVIQPGGSRRDAEVIEAANKAGVAMVFTGQRHFRH